MQEEFEKNIEQRLGNFSLQPSPMVWKEVDAALHPERKRRLAIWWLLPLLLLLAGAGAFLLLHNEKEVAGTHLAKIENHAANFNTGNNKQNLPPSSIKQQQQQPVKLPLIKSNADKKAALIIKLKDANTNIPALSFTKTQHAQKVTAFSNAGKDNAIKGDVKNTIDAEPVISSSLISAGNKREDRKELAVKTDKETIPQLVAEDSAKHEVTALKKVDSNTTATKKAITKISKAKKHQWLVTAGGGALAVGENNLFNNNNTEKAFASSNSNVTPGNGTGATAGQNVYPLTAPTNGFQLTAGIQYQQVLGKRWKLNTGLQYRYLQNKQQVKKDTSTFQNFLADRFLSSSYANVSGSIVTVANYAHWLEVPLTFSYSLNTSSKNRISLIGGGSMAWAISEKWLISDAANSKYYYSTSLNNTLLLNVSAGLSLDLNNKFQLALMAQQSLTPIHKNVTDKFYYTQYSIQVSKPINFNKFLHKSSTKK